MAQAEFNGTSVSGAHIGDKAAKNLAKALFETTEPVQLALSLGAEAANVIRLTIQAQDREGRAVVGVIRLNMRLHNAAMVESIVTAASLSAVSGGGTFVTTDVQAGAVIDTEADGTALVDITDVSGVLAGDLNLLIEPVDREGRAHFLAVTFA